MTDAAHLLEPIRALHERIRDAVVAACTRQTSELLAAVASDAEGDGDTIYAIDRVGEDTLVQGLADVAREEPLCLMAEGLPGDAAGNLVRRTHHVGSVEQKAILFGPGSADGYLGCVAALHGAYARKPGHCDPRLQLGQFIKAAPIERQVDNLRRFDDSADRRGRCVHERRLRSHFDLFGYLPYLQCEIDDYFSGTNSIKVCTTAQCEKNWKSDESCISNPKFQNLKLDFRIYAADLRIWISDLRGRMRPMAKCLSPQGESIKICTHGGFL